MRPISSNDHVRHWPDSRSTSHTSRTGWCRNIAVCQQTREHFGQEDGSSFFFCFLLRSVYALVTRLIASFRRCQWMSSVPLLVSTLTVWGPLVENDFLQRREEHRLSVERLHGPVSRSRNFINERRFLSANRIMFQRIWSSRRWVRRRIGVRCLHVVVLPIRFLLGFFCPNATDQSASCHPIQHRHRRRFFLFYHVMFIFLIFSSMSADFRFISGVKHAHTLRWCNRPIPSDYLWMNWSLEMRRKCLHSVRR